MNNCSLNHSDDWENNY